MSDGGGSRVWQWIRTGVMLVLAYLLFTLIQAADRNRQSTEELKKQLVKFADIVRKTPPLWSPTGNISMPLPKAAAPSPPHFPLNRRASTR